MVESKSWVVIAPIGLRRAPILLLVQEKQPGHPEYGADPLKRSG
jgi:hypothetical protein